MKVKKKRGGLMKVHKTCFIIIARLKGGKGEEGGGKQRNQG